METPVLLVGFNRPKAARLVLDEILRSSPGRVYLFCDGPRKGSSQDTAKVEEVRDLFESCPAGGEIFLNFQEHNLGIRDAMVTAIDWFFSGEESGIVLEDDCVPTPDFFYLMGRFLAQYKNHKNIWGATGWTPCPSERATGQRISFIRSALVWGWCTWSDRWQQYDRDLNNFRSMTSRNETTWRDGYERHALDFNLRQLLDEEPPHTWDTQLAWTVTRNDGLWGIPPVNTISNIGVGAGATHTRRVRFRMPPVSKLPEALALPEKPKRDVRLQHCIHRQVHSVWEPLMLNHARDIGRRLKLWAIRAGRFLGRYSFN